MDAALESGKLSAEDLSIALEDAEKGGRRRHRGRAAEAGAVPPPKADFAVEPATLARYAGTLPRRGRAGRDDRAPVVDGVLHGRRSAARPFQLGAFDALTFRPHDNARIVRRDLQGGCRAVSGFTLKTARPRALVRARGGARHETSPDFALVLAPPPSSAQNWPSFRGEKASGVSTGAPTPTTWDATKGTHIAWKTEIPGLAVSSPIVWGDTVYVTTAVSSDPAAVFRHGLYGDVEPSKDVTRHSWRVYAIDKRTGRVRWERVAHEGVRRRGGTPSPPRPRVRPRRTGRSWSPTSGRKGSTRTTRKASCCGSGTWARSTPDGSTTPTTNGAPPARPILYKDLVIVQADRQQDSFVAAFRVKDGEPAWRTVARRDPLVGNADRLRRPAARRADHARHEVHPRLRPAHGEGAVAARPQLRGDRPHADRRARPDLHHERLSRRSSRSTRCGRAARAT